MIPIKQKMNYALFFLSLVMLFISFYLNFGGKTVERPGALHEGFVYISDVVPDAVLEPRYFSTYNFIGKRIEGYEAPQIILSKEAADALKKASDSLQSQGFAIKVFDAYRPQKAVDMFMKWAADESDDKMRAVFYPEIEKSRLIPDKYIAERSGHTRGSTVDLTLIVKATGKELDMGSPYDFFGLISHHGTSLITPEQTANREILKNAMLECGFKLYDEEWWHYTLENEPYPETYFEFEVR